MSEEVSTKHSEDPDGERLRVMWPKKDNLAVSIKVLNILLNQQLSSCKVFKITCLDVCTRIVIATLCKYTSVKEGLNYVPCIIWNITQWEKCRSTCINQHGKNCRYRKRQNNTYVVSMSENYFVKEFLSVEERSLPNC